MQSDILSVFVKDFSNSLVHEEVRAFIKQEALKQFDGDYDFLVAEAKNRPLSIPSRPEIKVFGDLFNNFSTSKGNNTLEKSQDFLRVLKQKYPLLQIHLPELWEGSTKDWDPTLPYSGLVAVLPLSEDLDDEIVAYNNNTDKWTTLPELVAPDEVTIVISINERLTHTRGDIKKYDSRAKKLCPVPVEVFEDGEDRYYYKPDVADYDNCEGGRPTGPPGGKPGPVTPKSLPFCDDADREKNNSSDQVSLNRLATIEAFRRMNEWADGEHEIIAHITYANSQGGPTTLDVTWFGRSDDFRTCTWFHCDPDVYDGEYQDILAWDPDIYGGIMKYVWEEYDDGRLREVSFKVGAKFKVAGIFEVGPEIGFKLDLTNKSDRLGEKNVDYCHATKGDGKEYKTHDRGVIFFVRQE